MHQRITAQVTRSIYLSTYSHVIEAGSEVRVIRFDGDSVKIALPGTSVKTRVHRSAITCP